MTVCASPRDYWFPSLSLVLDETPHENEKPIPTFLIEAVSDYGST